MEEVAHQERLGAVDCVVAPRGIFAVVKGVAGFRQLAAGWEEGLDDALPEVCSAQSGRQSVFDFGLLLTRAGRKENCGE